MLPSVLPIQAPAKINLILEIQGKRPDGYHELKTVMHTLDLADTLTIRPRQAGIKITCDHPARSISAMRAKGVRCSGKTSLKYS